MAPSSKPSRRPSPVLTAYLTAYNLASAAAWGYVLYRAVEHMDGGDGYTGLRERLGVQGGWATLDKRARSGVDEFGQVVKWVQTAACLEAVHSALRLVRSPLGTTVAQIFSRLALVWGVCELFPAVPHSPFYISMVTAWSCAEIIRYIHYATGLVGVKVKALEWLRYTAFYILYPVGAGSEAVLIFKSAAHAKEEYGTLAQLGVYAFVSIWPVALFGLMTYMHAQRRKHLSPRPASSSSSSSTPSKRSPSTAVAPAPAPVQPSTPSGPSYASIASHSPSATAAEEVVAATPESKVLKAPRDVSSRVAAENIIPTATGQTPARSTRSRAKKQ
ncbi:hypothetical protein JCM8097_002821 [Rhodosporidiobolus ruineniae]